MCRSVLLLDRFDSNSLLYEELFLTLVARQNRCLMWLGFLFYASPLNGRARTGSYAYKLNWLAWISVMPCLSWQCKRPAESMRKVTGFVSVMLLSNTCMFFYAVYTVLFLSVFSWQCVLTVSLGNITDVHKWVTSVTLGPHNDYFVCVVLQFDECITKHVFLQHGELLRTLISLFMPEILTLALVVTLQKREYHRLLHFTPHGCFLNNVLWTCMLNTVDTNICKGAKVHLQHSIIKLNT